MPFRETAFYLDPWMTSHATTMFMLVVFGWLLPAGAVLLLAVERARLRALAAHDRAAQATTGAPLVPGPVVIAGKVDDDGEGPAVTITIEQTGKEVRNKSSYSHWWTERRREVMVRAFYVVRPTGERVRVEPDERVFLVDKLDGLEAIDAARRVRRATLTAGEPVYVMGVAVRGFDPRSGGYRDGGQATIVRPPSGRRMLLSTETLAERHELGARVAGKALAFALLLFAFLHLVWLMRVDALALFGHVERAVAVGNAHTWREWVKPKNGPGHWVAHYGVTVAAPAPIGSFDAETSFRFYERVLTGSDSEAPLLVAGSFAQLGSEASLSERSAVLLPPFVGFALLILFLWKGSKLPWYERKRVIDAGRGHLDPQTVSLR